MVFGTLVAWVLVRYRFPGRRIVDAMVDLPFALPTAVAGIALTTLYAPKGWIGSLLRRFGIKVAYTPLGIIIALIFIGLPFVVRTVQPVMEEIDREVEEAAATLGATACRRSRGCCCRAWRRPSSPASRSPSPAPSANTARSSSSPATCRSSTEITPLLIVIKLEEYNYAAATAIAAIMLLISFAMLLVINLLQAWSRKRHG